MFLLVAVLAALHAGLGHTQSGFVMSSDLQQRALGGNLEAQRELADCLTKGCPGIEANRSLACAWRIVIVAGGTAGVTASDVEQRRLICANLSSDEQRQAASQARSIVKQVYGRDLVLPADFFEGPARAK
jgi:hypothetical protein